MIIRRVKKEDFEEEYAIEQSCFKDPYPRKHLEYEFFENPINEILVAECDEKVVGFIDYMVTFNSATINQIAVLPEYRKQKIASTLLKEMEKRFPTNLDDVVENITLEVRKSNEAAINLYKKDGYKIIELEDPVGSRMVYKLKPELDIIKKYVEHIKKNI